MAATDGSEYLDVEVGGSSEHFRRMDSTARTEREEEDLLWAAIERLPSSKRLNFAILRKETVDVTHLDRQGRQLLLQNALATNEQDNYNLLAGIKTRVDRVGLEVPKVDVKFHKLKVSANVHVGTRALPTLPNYIRNTAEGFLTSLRILKPKKHSLTILDDVSGVVKPGRMTLLLGPPSSGKSTLLLALAGKLDSTLKVSGEVKYNGKSLNEFCVQRTSAYISQTDNHIGELTVRETLDFAARCQGANENFAEYLKELPKLEKERNVRPSPDIDAFMKPDFAFLKSNKHEFVEQVMALVELDNLRHALVGLPGSSGLSTEQRKRLTIAVELVANPSIIFMDEPTSCLDARAAVIVMRTVRNTVDTGRTVICTIHQPSIDIFEAFDELLLMKRGGRVIYGGMLGVNSQIMINYFEGESSKNVLFLSLCSITGYCGGPIHCTADTHIWPYNIFHDQL